MKCFKCENELKPSVEGNPHQPHRGTMWTSTGNYGSYIFDPITYPEYLLLVVCDSCLKAHVHLVQGFRDGDPVPARNLIA